MRYKVSGTDKETGETRQCVIDAYDEHHARYKAADLHITVTSISEEEGLPHAMHAELFKLHWREKFSLFCLEGIGGLMLIVGLVILIPWALSGSAETKYDNQGVAGVSADTLEMLSTQLSATNATALLIVGLLMFLIAGQIRLSAAIRAAEPMQKAPLVE